MKILIPVLGFGNAGGYRVLSKLADELIQLGNSVDFLSPDSNYKPYYPTMARILWIDDTGKISTSHQLPTAKETAFSIQQKLTKALRQLSKDAYDVILANHSLTVFPVKRAGWAKKTLYYVQAYEPDFYTSLGGLKNKILSRLSAMTYGMKLFTVVNAALYQDFKKLQASRVLYPGVDTTVFYPKEKIPPKEKSDKIVIGTVGRIERIKGTQYVLEAFKLLRATYPNIELHVAFGNAADFAGYEGVYCFQPHGDQALADFYRSLDYYFCAAFVQLGAFHYPVAESMCCGVPLITTHYYPADESNAFITQPHQVTSIVKQFETAVEDVATRENKIALALEEAKKLDWKIVAQRLIGYMVELTSAYAGR